LQKEAAGQVKKNYSRFIEISLGSTFELETQLLIAQAVRYGDAALTSELLNSIDQEQKMLMSFMNKLQ
jgi:four helix bundle protein